MLVFLRKKIECMLVVEVLIITFTLKLYSTFPFKINCPTLWRINENEAMDLHSTVLLQLIYTLTETYYLISYVTVCSLEKDHYWVIRGQRFTASLPAQRAAGSESLQHLFTNNLSIKLCFTGVVQGVIEFKTPFFISTCGWSSVSHTVPLFCLYVNQVHVWVSVYTFNKDCEYIYLTGNIHMKVKASAFSFNVTQMDKSLDKQVFTDFISHSKASSSIIQ